MANSSFTEAIVEDAALGWLESLGYAVQNGQAIAPSEPSGNKL